MYKTLKNEGGEARSKYTYRMQVSTFRSKKEDQREHEQETRSQSTRWVRRVCKSRVVVYFGVLPGMPGSRVADEHE
jgi:hypothetical protein